MMQSPRRLLPLFNLLLTLPFIAAADTVVASVAAAADHVSMTKEAANIRSQHLARKKPILQKSVSITSLLFPGAEPIKYEVINEDADIRGDSSPLGDIPMYVEYVESRKTPVGVDYFHLSVCPQQQHQDEEVVVVERQKESNVQKKNLGQRLMGHTTKTLPYKITPIQPKSCTILCHVQMTTKQLNLMRKLILKQYRVHYTLDSLPVLVRSKDLNHALRGYPLGFAMPSDNSSSNSRGETKDEIYLNNHLKFTIYYNTNVNSNKDGEESEENGKYIHVTGFDVTPVSIQHSADVSTCNSESAPLENRRETLLPLNADAAGEGFNIVYSYEVEWKESEIEVRGEMKIIFYFYNSLKVTSINLCFTFLITVA